MRKLGQVTPRNNLFDLGKLFQGKTAELVMNQKGIDLRQQSLSINELMLTLVLKYQGALFPDKSRK